jgi:hypothetical protein
MKNTSVQFFSGREFIYALATSTGERPVCGTNFCSVGKNNFRKNAYELYDI